MGVLHPSCPSPPSQGRTGVPARYSRPDPVGRRPGDSSRGAIGEAHRLFNAHV
jgi:hypothetical protein